MADDANPNIPTFSSVNLSAMTYHDLSEYRQELRHAIWNPGTEWDVLDPDAAAIEEAYRVQLGKVDAIIATFGNNDPAKGQDARYEK